MINDNSVIFKGTKNGLTILLSPDIDFNILKNHLEKKIEDAKDFFKDAKTSIMFKGRDLTEEEEYQLLQIITKKTELNISYIFDEETSIDMPEKIEKSLRSVQLNDEREQIDKTKYYKGTIRSGQCLEFDGSVVVIGDVNPGGEIYAEGNIIILGSLKGIVHAGCKGYDKAFIAALIMKPMQLRICNIITRSPDNPDYSTHAKVFPQVAYLSDGNIYIEPIDYKLLENL
ncbi:MAG: septum site-determining protein MinC [Epulopiscium sp.]|nr:septum site-determining protein MinC [Candidatus Epulonipiscium sp.]HOQ16122.1 septum site-determining protein MinC [Defluviitaleaceae bacterium]HPT76877.1 septum site-determining protein MinC [Defluviitaleaceae bacterium]